MQAPDLPRPIGALVNDLGDATTIDACRDLLVEAVTGYGLPVLYYVGAAMPLSADGAPTVITNLPDDWRQQYLRSACHKSDPIVDLAARSVLPVIWDQPSEVDGVEQAIGQVMALAQAAGLVRGMSVPVHGLAGRFAALVVATGQPREELDRLAVLHGPELHYLALHFTVAVERCTAAPPPPAANLTQRETECLYWAAQGKTSWETAVILEVAEVTVNFHLKNVMKKLGVSNRVHAVAQAVALGLIAA